MHSASSIPFLDTKLPLPFRLTSELPFSKADIKEFPWLRKKERFYGVEKELDRSGRTITYLGFVSDKNGKSIPKFEEFKIVIKIPNLNIQDTAEQISIYLNLQKQATNKEWPLTRARLKDCKHANPIFDMDSLLVSYTGDMIDVPITIQKFLSESPLLKYLEKKFDGDVLRNRQGITSESDWIKLVRCFAVGLSDIHQRRVVHGDIWPPNIFINEKSENPEVIFIDFGESFPIEFRSSRNQVKDHEYRAPEREDQQNDVDHSADVYSFGKLIFHLAIGEEIKIPRHQKGYNRRKFIREKIKGNNSSLIKANPFITDLICNCVAYDPVDRPNMTDIIVSLDLYVDRELVDKRIPDVLKRLNTVRSQWSKIHKKAGPFLEEIIEQKVYETEQLINSLNNDVIILHDTREKILMVLVNLFQRLQKGDKFISLTSPSMWQSSALGLDGRYFTASELAALRNASIQRTFIFSVEEVGAEWVSALICELSNSASPLNKSHRDKLIETLKYQLDEYKKNAKIPSSTIEQVEMDKVQKHMRKRITLIIKAYSEASLSICKGLFNTCQDFPGFESCQNIYLGLYPIDTLKHMREEKTMHPYSVFCYNTVKDERDRFLLMRTECHARNFYDDILFQAYKPELRGLWVFRSSLGVPKDRIKNLEKVLTKSINIGCWVEELYEILDKIDKEKFKV